MEKRRGIHQLFALTQCSSFNKMFVFFANCRVLVTKSNLKDSILSHYQDIN